VNVSGLASPLSRAQKVHARIEASWERILDLESVVEGVTDEPGERCVQATLWSVPARAVRGITPFVAR
jgi:hypothetical protein